MLEEQLFDPNDQVSEEISEEETKYYGLRAEEICKTLHGVSKVHPIVMIDKTTKKRVVAYLQEPNFETKVRVMDKAIQIGFYSAAKELMDGCLLKEHSNPLSFGESNECDNFKMGVVEECLFLVKRVSNQYKKK